MLGCPIPPRSSDAYPRPRACALIFNPDNPQQILLILRRKGGHAYATLPGGGIEAGETPAEAAAREVLEEVNLSVRIGEQVLEMDNSHGDKHSHEHYFLATVTGGEMRLGDGPEGLRNSEANHYEPQWVDVARLDEVNLVPEVLRGLVRERQPS
ncbi:NUDIX domain-containing protein [Deinococcus lacus]|uniref:NUDIX domain-containing protein n=1 Tax=Deinococcus lacus TaxID=392561 RepID=A0ABW1YD68_9DEIO